MAIRMLIFLAFLAVAAGGDDARLGDLIEALGSRDRAIREAAAVEIRKIGDPALAALEAKIRASGGGAWFDLYKELAIKRVETEPRREEPRREPPTIDLHNLPRPPADLPKESYVYGKLTEAVAAHDGGRYAEAEAIVSRLIALEPSTSYAEHLRELKALCDRAIGRDGEFRTVILADRSVYEVGETIALTLRIDNVGQSDLLFRFPVKRTSILEIVVTAVDSLGSTTAVERPEVFEFDAEIRVNAGSFWEKTYKHDTSMDGLNPSLFRFLRFQPAPIVAGMVKDREETDRKIAFDPATIRIVPKGYRDRIGNPLAALTKAIDSGTVQDVFIAAVMLGDEQKKTGIDLLITTLKNARGAGAQSVMRALGVLTGEDFGLDARKWIEWWENRAKTR